MYPADDPVDVADLVEVMAARTPLATFQKRAKRGDGYWAGISHDDDFDAHVAGTVEFIGANREALRSVRTAGARLQLDTAFDPEDHPRGGSLYRELELDEGLIAALASVGMTYAFTVYPGEYHPVDGLRTRDD